MGAAFEWDEAKSQSNLQKHGESFEEAASVFANPLAAIFADPDHSQDELREVIVGHSERNRLLVVSFTERGREDYQRPCRHDSRAQGLRREPDGRVGA